MPEMVIHLAAPTLSLQKITYHWRKRTKSFRSLRRKTKKRSRRSGLRRKRRRPLSWRGSKNLLKKRGLKNCKSRKHSKTSSRLQNVERLLLLKKIKTRRKNRKWKMPRLRLSEVTMPELRSNNKREHWWKCASNNREWWEHRMPSSSCSHSLVNLMAHLTKLLSHRLLIRAI